MFAFQQNRVGIVAEKSAVSKAALGEAAMAHVGSGAEEGCHSTRDIDRSQEPAA